MNVKFSADWEKLRSLLKVATLNDRLKKALGVATRVNAAVVKREIRDNIRKGSYADNRDPDAALTRWVKRSTVPLVDTGHLFRSVTVTVIGWGRAEIGVLRGDPEANVARTVHDGKVIPITERMRRMFKALADASDGKLSPSHLSGRAAELWQRRPGGWHALRAGTTHVRIPARPYLSEVMDDRDLNDLIARNWLIAGSRAMAGLPVSASHLRTKVG